MSEGSAKPQLPIGQGAGRGRGSSSASSSENRASRAWADYTPSGFEGYGNTPWSSMMLAGFGGSPFGLGAPGFPTQPGGGGAQPPARPPAPRGAPAVGLALQRPPRNSAGWADAAGDAAFSAAMAATAAGTPTDAMASSRPAPFNDDFSPVAGTPLQLVGTPAAADMAAFFMPSSSGSDALAGAAPSSAAPWASSATLASVGSQLHGTGNCRPCAWFFKPQSCQSAQSCRYCHLCPEGELKNRKKMKVAAMRRGDAWGSAPERRGGRDDHGASRTLQLNPLL